MEKQAEIIGEFSASKDGPVHGVSYDGTHVWAATGDAMRAFDPQSGAEVRSLAVAGHAGTAFDGRYLYQIADAVIQKVDPESGTVIATIPAPGGGKDSGMAWANGSLWVGQYREQQIIQIDAESGAVQRTIQTNRFVTGVTWVDDQLWHGYSDDGNGGLARLDPANGREMDVLDMPGKSVSGVESDGGGLFYCGGGNSGLIRVVKRA